MQSDQTFNTNSNTPRKKEDNLNDKGHVNENKEKQQIASKAEESQKIVLRQPNKNFQEADDDSKAELQSGESLSNQTKKNKNVQLKPTIKPRKASVPSTKGNVIKATISSSVLKQPGTNADMGGTVISNKTNLTLLKTLEANHKNLGRNEGTTYNEGTTIVKHKQHDEKLTPTLKISKTTLQSSQPKKITPQITLLNKTQNAPSPMKVYSSNTKLIASYVKMGEPSSNKSEGEPPPTLLNTLRVKCPEVPLESRKKVHGARVSEDTFQKKIQLNSGYNEGGRISPYINIVAQLPSVGPLTINDLDDFLKKSKLDFEHFYNVKSVSDYQITDFNLKQVLGIGAFGRVVLGEFKKDKTLYALKILDKQGAMKQNQIRYVSNEKRILQGLNFPFVICLKWFFTDFYYLYFVLPYVPGGNLYKHMKSRKKLNESEAKFYIAQLVLALEYLHYLQLIHRDLKLENIMIDAYGYLKLVDFGQCIRFYGHDKTWTITGTPEYMAPEIIEGKGYDCAVDWWALGIITFEICSGFRPFMDENKQKLQILILCSTYKIPNDFSSSLKKFIQGLLVQEPKKRIANYNKKASVLKKHVWFKGMDWLALLNRRLEAPYLPKLQENLAIQQKDPKK